MAERPDHSREVRELGSLRRIASELTRTVDVEGVVRTLLDELGELFGVGFVALTFVSDDGGEATGFLARSNGEDVPWWNEIRLDLRSVSSGIASAVFEAAAFTVYDVTASTKVSSTLAERVGAKSAAYVPLSVDDRVIAVISVATTDDHRIFTANDLETMQTLASEAAVALERTRTALALNVALEENRQRLQQQGALLRAAQVLSGELELGAVLQRLADQLARLLDADAADCYLLDESVLRCAAVCGLDEGLIGFEFGATRGLAGVALREERPVIESEYGEIPDPVPHPAYEGFTDALVAPMRWSDVVRGVLGVGRRGGNRFTREDAEVLETFAGLASLAVRNAETYAQSTRQARIQRGFYRIASVLGQSLSRPATLTAIAQAATEALGGTAAAVLVPTGGHLEPLGSYELPADFVELLFATSRDEEGALFRAAERGRIVAGPSLSEDERLPETWRAAGARHGYSAFLSVPVEAPRAVGSGLVLVFFAEERAFTDDDLELASHLAEATRGALERSELFEAERNARALAQQLARTGRLLTSELDPEAVLDEVVQQAPELVNAEAAAFRLLDGEELVVTAAEGPGAEQALDSRCAASSRLSGDVLQSSTPVTQPTAGEDERLRALDPMLAAGNVSYLGVPVAGGEGAPAGVLSVYSRSARAWREEEVEALLALAASTAAALSNAELYQRVALERERSVAILANIADGIVAVDREGDVVLWNAAAERITGVPATVALGRTPAEVLQRSLEGPDGTPGDRLVSITRGREEVWLSVTEAVMRDPLGGVAGRIFAFRDISGDRLVEQVKSDFVSTVSHELRTPLTSIYGFAETLLRRDVNFGEDERRIFLQYVATESQRLTAIVDTLLNVARLDTGDLQVNLADTDVRDVVGQVVSAVPEAAVNGHRFVVELPDEPLPVRADPDKLRQVCSILVDNALKYSPDGGTVTVGAVQRREAVEVSVADEGIGIPQADQEQIFRKFYRGTDADQRGGAGGTGLGLFIARGLVTAMGGRIHVSSREGEGSRFAVELPLGTVAESDSDDDGV
ncbi:MAG TPA: GAF domain-containing protein [Gaiellaceae bacterium]|nr:GAF domain-containing protein [Gaiellaceae bacterium]